MTSLATGSPSADRRPASRSIAGPAVLSTLLLAAAGALALLDLGARLPPDRWMAAIDLSAASTDLDLLLVHFAVLPRVAMALLAGSALGLSGVIFQQVLRNPLAEPATLGVSAGAYLAIAVATFLAPSWLAVGREGVAFAGAGLAMACVLALSWRRALSPLALILAGLMVTLTCGAVATALALFHDQGLTSLFLWASGSLVQTDWSGVTYLLPRLAFGLIAALLLLRPLTVLGLDEGTAVGLGIPAAFIRLLGIAVAVALAAAVTASVGVIGFVGLAAPAFARLAGARRFADRLFWAPVIGAGLLALADQIAGRIGFGFHELPAGVATALIGAPLMIVLLPLLRRGTASVPPGQDLAHRADHPWRLISIGLCLLPLVIWLALAVGQGLHGWEMSGWDRLPSLLFWRAPRIAGGLAAGAMLAGAGCLIQRLTGNPMAGPEVLGISAGSVFFVIAAMLAGLQMDAGTRFAAAAAGAATTFAALLAAGHREQFSAERMLLCGVALNTAFAAVVALFIGSGDPRALPLLRWISGSTYLLRGTDAVVAVAAAVVLVTAALPLHRWLTLLPLGNATARAAGLDLGRSRLTILIVAGLLTAGGTLIAGPLTFVGLMAPHMAAMLGVRRPVQQLLCAALIGATLIVAADWIGRNLLFPNELPAGLVATLVGGPYFLWLMQRRPS